MFFPFLRLLCNHYIWTDMRRCAYHILWKAHRRTSFLCLLQYCFYSEWSTAGTHIDLFLQDKILCQYILCHLFYVDFKHLTGCLLLWLTCSINSPSAYREYCRFSHRMVPYHLLSNKFSILDEGYWEFSYRILNYKFGMLDVYTKKESEPTNWIVTIYYCGVILMWN